MLIRRALPSDAERIWKVHTASIRHFCSDAYTPEQIDEWTGLLTPERYLDGIESLDFVVAEIDGQVQGFCILNLETGELHAIYLAPEAAGVGYGRQLMDWAEGAARQRGWEELSVKATLNAVSFYENCGYSMGRTTNQPLPSGTARACVEMRKRLRGDLVGAAEQGDAPDEALS